MTPPTNPLSIFKIPYHNIPRMIYFSVIGVILNLLNHSFATVSNMRKVSISYYKDGEEIIGMTDGVTVYCKIRGQDKEVPLNNFVINWFDNPSAKK